jgi:A118 family predicted phage portal protein
VVSENSKTYKTIKTIQDQLAPAVEHLVRNIVDVASLYEMDFEGRKIEELAKGGYHVNITFDDGVTQDRQTNINEGITLVGAGLMSKKTFLTDPKYGQGLTEDAAAAELQQIADEQRVGGSAVDLINLQTAE